MAARRLRIYTSPRRVCIGGACWLDPDYRKHARDVSADGAFEKPNMTNIFADYLVECMCVVWMQSSSWHPLQKLFSFLTIAADCRQFSSHRSRRDADSMQLDSLASLVSEVWIELNSHAHNLSKRSKT